MKTFILSVYFTLLILPQVSFSSECNLDSGHDYWAPKLGLLSQELGSKVEEWVKENSFSKTDLTLALKWRDALYLSSEEISQTFDLEIDKIKKILIKPIDGQLFDEKKWKGKTEDFPRIDFIQGNYDFSTDQYFPSILQLNNDSAETIEIDTHSEVFARRCRSIIECSSATTNSCEIYLDSWTTALSMYAFKASQLAPKKIAKLSVKYEEEWSTFFRDARSQTVLDRLATTAMYRKELQSDRFAAPPELQLFFLHPGVVAEYTGSAPNGDKSDLGLALEWVGINSWKKCPLNPFSDFNFGCGMSIVSLYSDKISIKSVRHGLMFHVDNHYSFGVVREKPGEGGVGVFLSLDLLKSFESIEGKINDWSSSVDSVFD